MKRDMPPTCPICGCPRRYWLTTTEVAVAMSVTTQTVRNLIKRWALVGVLVGGRWRVRHESLDEYLETRVTAEELEVGPVPEMEHETAAGGDEERENVETVEMEKQKLLW